MLPNANISHSSNKYDRKKISEEFRLKKIDQTKIYFLEEIKQKHTYNESEVKKLFMTLNHIEQSLILASATTGCISISAFTLLNGIPVDIASSALVL